MNLDEFAALSHRRARAVEAQAPKIVADGAVAAGKAVIDATPVDTGLARGNWRLGLGSEDFSEEGPRPVASAVAAMRGVANNFRLGSKLVLSNPVAYIARIANGNGSSAPVPFQRIAALAAKLVTLKATFNLSRIK